MSILESAEEVGRSTQKIFAVFFKQIHKFTIIKITRFFVCFFPYKKSSFFKIIKIPFFSFRWLFNFNGAKITQISFRFTDKLHFGSISPRLRWNCRRRCRLLQSLQRFWVRPRMCSFKSNSGPGAIWRRLWRFLLAPYRTRWHSCGCENM